MLKCCLNVRGELGRGLFVCIIRKKNVNHINKLLIQNTTLSYILREEASYVYMIKYFYTSRFNL